MKSSKESAETFSTDKPSTSKSSDESKTSTETKCETSKPTELKNESDSETQNTTCSEESTEEHKRKIPSPLDNLKLLESAINELLIIVEKKA